MSVHRSWKTVSSVITEDDLKELRNQFLSGFDMQDKMLFIYFRKVVNSPFGKGSLKDIKEPEKNKIYSFSNGYAFYLSPEYGLIKLLYFRATHPVGLRVDDKNKFFIFNEEFDESLLVEVVKNGKKK